MPKTEVITTVEIDDIKRILMSNPDMRKKAQNIVKKVLRKARTNISKDSKQFMKDDPRQAYKAVKFAVYKRLLGGNVSILQKRKASNTRVKLNRRRKLDDNPHQRGGNRRKRNARTEQVDSYFGSDRGFILRFINGTDQRTTRYGNRGSIRKTDWFSTVAASHVQAAAQEFADEMTKEIDK